MKKLFVLLTSTLFLTSLLAHAMENHENTPKMKTLATWEDVKAFAGCIVAYKIRGGSLGAGKEYPLDSSDPTLKYGYIYPYCYGTWTGGKKGYTMDRLLKFDAVSSTFGLTDSCIKKLSPFLMRHADDEELTKLRQALKNKKAQMAYHWGEEGVRKILNAKKKLEQIGYNDQQTK